MSSLDQFESVFRKSIREHYTFGEIRLKKILLITDLNPQQRNYFQKQVEAYLGQVLEDEYSLLSLGEEHFSNWPQLRDRIREFEPDLMISYRLLRVSDEQIETSLGVYIDTLSQYFSIPILVLPHPGISNFDDAHDKKARVIVATEHNYTDRKIIDYAVRLTPVSGKVKLVHIENEDNFEYYMKAIERIPEIDTDKAREGLREELIHGPEHYLKSVENMLRKHRPDVEVETYSGIGHLISSYRKILEGENVRLLVFHSQDETQLAMHSLGYSLAIEFKGIPVLLV